MKDLPDISIDSTSKLIDKTPFSAEVDLKIKGVVKKIVDVDFSTNLNSEEKIVEYNNFFNKIANQFPEHDKFKLFFRVQRIMYCEYYERICLNSSISDKEFDIRLEHKYQELDSLIKKYFNISEPDLIDKNTPILNKDKHTLIKKKHIEIDKCAIFSEKESSTYLNSYSNLCSYLLRYGIEISYSKDGLKELDLKGRYYYEGGHLQVYINGKEIILYDFILNPQSRQGNPKVLVEQLICDNIMKMVNNRRLDFQTQIKNAFCK